MLDVAQFRVSLLRPTLQSLEMWSQAAENLLLGTALVESNLVYLKQLGNGPAVGFFMIEPATYLDLRTRLSVNYPKIYQKALSILCINMLPINANFLIGNITASIIMARIKYFLNSAPMPEANDYVSLAKYHKKIYNTSLGATDLSKSTEIFKSVVDGGNLG